MPASLNRGLICLAAFGLLAAPAVAAQDLASLGRDVAAVKGRVIVGIKPANAARGMVRPGVRSLTQEQVGSIARRLAGHGLRVIRNYRLITAVSGVATEAALPLLLKDPNVEYVVADRIHKLQDERHNLHTVPRPLAETTPYGITTIHAPDAWAVTNPANYGAGVKVGILDTGGDFDHEDLNYAGGFDAVLSSTAPADWNDDIAVCEGHGTHVAGTVAAQRGNNLGVVGVAPGASVYAIQIFVEYPDPIFGFPQCGAFTSDIVNGVDWAVTNGIQVVNMSYGGLGEDPAEHAAYQAAFAAGVHLVAASGNAGLPTTGFTPASYPEVIAVAATDASDAWGTFSNSGPEVFVSAPGVSVLSTLPGNTYAMYTGTSMASPHVTGLVALLLAVDPTLSDASLRGLLAAGAADLGAPGRDDLFGEGRINAQASVTLAHQQSTTATQLALVQQPGPGTSGQPLTPAPTVELRDGSNQAVLQAGVVVTATVTSGPGIASVLDRKARKSRVPGETKRLPVEPATVSAITNASGQAVFSSLTINTVLTAPHELTFSAASLTPAVTAPFTVTGSVVTLANGVAVPNVAGAFNSQAYFVLDVPAGFGQLVVTTVGGTGDPDLFVKFGSPPNIGSWDCASTQFAPADETCSISNPSAGLWYVMVFGYEAYTGLTVTATASGTGATQMAMIQQPQPATSGQPLSPAPSVQLLDAQSQPVALPGLLVTAAISSGPGQVSVIGRQPAGKKTTADREPVQPMVLTAVTDANGQATFPDLTVTSLTTADHQLGFTASNVTPLVSSPFSVTGTTPTPLTSGVPVNGLGGPAGTNQYFVIAVPASQGNLTVTTGGGTGDVDLYVKLGDLPTRLSYTCRPFLIGSAEVCAINNPVAGNWYILVNSYDPSSGATLTATYSGVATKLAVVQQPGPSASGQPITPAPVVQLLDAQDQPLPQAGRTVTAALASGPGELSRLPVGPAGAGKRPPIQTAVTTAVTNASGQATFANLRVSTINTADHQLVFSSANLASATSNTFSVTGTTLTTLTNGVAVTGLSGAVGTDQFFVLAVPAGQQTLTVATAGTTGDPDLYVRFGALPTQATNDCSSLSFTPNELCVLSSPAEGNWYIMVHAYGAYSGLSLTATYQVAVVPQYDVTVTGHGTGSGTVAGAGLDCDIAAGAATGTCTTAVDSGTTVSLTATPGTSVTFSGWSGACTGTGNCGFEVDEDATVTATFSSPPADVTNMVAELTGTPSLSPEDIARWDCNSTADFDVGDLLCYLDNNPGLTLAPQVLTALRYRAATARARPPAATGKPERAKRGN